MQPVHLTPEIVARAALAAHAAGTLCAQNIAERDPNRPMNFYIRDAQPGVACAVGAALPEENARRAVYPASNTSDEVIHFDSIEDKLVIDRIQDLHDAWALAVHDNCALAPKKEAHFLEECHKHIPATPAP